MAANLQIGVLGEFRVLRGTEQLVLPPSKKTRALLAYLAVMNKRQRRDHLCEMFWETPDDPRASLRWSLTKLRRVLNQDSEAACLKADPDGVFLDPTGFELDLRDVARLSQHNVAAITTPELEKLAATFRGRFLEDLELPRCPGFQAWRTYRSTAVERARTLILRTLVERLRDHPSRAQSWLDALQTMGANDEERRPKIPVYADGSGPHEADDRPPQEIRYCRSRDGVRIAYAISGHGPPILRAAHWMSHLQYEWESPVWRHWIDALSLENTLVRYDERGNGLSDRNAKDLSFEAMLSDLEAVADATGLDRFSLLGVSQSCAVSVAYAVRHPDRVARLVLYGGYARGWRKRGNRHEVDTHEAMTTLIREGWGKDNPAFRQLFTEAFIPGASREQMAWFNDLQKKSASPISASRLHHAFGDMDVVDILSKVHVPTLVLHARDDAAVPFDQGKTLAAGIHGARFVDLNSANHILLKDEPAFVDFLRELKLFLVASAESYEFGSSSVRPA